MVRHERDIGMVRKRCIWYVRVLWHRLLWHKRAFWMECRVRMVRYVRGEWLVRDVGTERLLLGKAVVPGLQGLPAQRRVIVDLKQRGMAGMERIFRRSVRRWRAARVGYVPWAHNDCHDREVSVHSLHVHPMHVNDEGLPEDQKERERRYDDWVQRRQLYRHRIGRMELGVRGAICPRRRHGLVRRH